MMKLALTDLTALKQQHQRITMVTAYDFALRATWTGCGPAGRFDAETKGSSSAKCCCIVVRPQSQASPSSVVPVAS